MPEGPEVKKLVNNLNTYRGLYIIDCKITPTSRYRDKAPDNYLLFKEKLPLKLKKVCCKGKLIYFIFKPKFFYDKYTRYVWILVKKKRKTCFFRVKLQIKR